MDVLGDRWNGVSGALGASNGSHKWTEIAFTAVQYVSGNELVS